MHAYIIHRSLGAATRLRRVTTCSGPKNDNPSPSEAHTSHAVPKLLAADFAVFLKQPATAAVNKQITDLAIGCR